MNRQKVENDPRKGRFSFTARKEAVIYGSLNLWRFPLSFPANRFVASHGVS